MYFLKADEEQHQYYNGIAYKTCDFEYRDGYSEQVCERTIDEFSVLVYNCYNIDKKKVVDEDPITKIKYLNDTYSIDRFSDTFLLTEDIEIEGFKKNFKKYKLFTTSFINHGPYPLIIECYIPHKKNTFQKVNILLHLRTNAEKKDVMFCDFTKSNNYNFLNMYVSGKECNLTISSNTIFGFKCPEGSIKKPVNCFSEVFVNGEIFKLEDNIPTNFRIYTTKKSNLAIARFINYYTKSYKFECHCVDKIDEKNIINKTILKYVNYGELFDYHIYDKIDHKPLIKNPQKTHLCDFFSEEEVLKPLYTKPKSYICIVKPKPLDYIALNCPISLVDEKNEQKISEIVNSEVEKLDELKMRLKKRNLYSNLIHFPKNAPIDVINKNTLNIVGIKDIIPGVLIKDIININITDGEAENGDIISSDAHIDKLSTNNLYDKYLGIKNHIQNGFFIFQLPPYLKRDQNIEIACVNDETKKGKNIGSVGVMIVYIKSSGNIIDGCYFYKKEENSYIKKSIKVGSGEDCVITSDGHVEYIGIDCSTRSGLFLTPSQCFLESYDASDRLVRISDYGKGLVNYSDEKGISYLKIPTEFLVYVNIFCYCNTEKEDGHTIKKQNKINIILNPSNKGVSEIRAIDHIYEPNFFIGNEYVNKKASVLSRKKHICDFTKKESSLEPEDELLVIHSCVLELPENLSMVEIKCPKSVKGNSERKETDEDGKPDEDYDQEKELFKYEKMKYIPNSQHDKLLIKKSEQNIEEALPGIILLDRNRTFSEKGSFIFVSPLIVQNDITIKIYCDNSETIVDKKRGKKGLVVVKIVKNVFDKKLYGCDFSGSKQKYFYYSSTYDLKQKSETCEIDLKEDMIVSLNCPHGKINPNNCFSSVYIKSNMGNVIKEDIENIFNEITVIEFSYLINSPITFLIISKLTKKEINFYCTCEDYENKNVGTIYIKNKEKFEYLNKGDNDGGMEYIFVDVTPYYFNNIYVCDFTEEQYSISLNKEVDIITILKNYLDMVSLNKHNEFVQFSLNLKFLKENLKNQYINYLKMRIEQLEKDMYNEKEHENKIIVYNCNIDLNAFDKFLVKCPKTEGNSPNMEIGNITYKSNLGQDQSTMLKGLSSILYGTLLVNKKKNSSFFKSGELELIISPYADSSKNLTFSCENIDKNRNKGKIGSASVFINKNDNKILGCDFIDISNSNTYNSNDSNESIYHKKNSFEFKVDLVEGKTIYCNIEAVDNDVVGFSCPYNFVTSPRDCFKTVQKQGLDKEFETHKIENLIKGAVVLNNDMYLYNYTPSYIILPKKIDKSHKIFCTCNSINQIKKGIIQINIIGEDLNNWFKKEITHNVYGFEKFEYLYDFSFGPLSISSENVLSLSPEFSGFLSTFRLDKNFSSDSKIDLKMKEPINFNKEKKVLYKSFEEEPIAPVSPNSMENLENNNKNGNSGKEGNEEIVSDDHGEDGKEKHPENNEEKENPENNEEKENPEINGEKENTENDGEKEQKKTNGDEEHQEEDEDEDEENVLNPLRTKYIYEVNINASELSKIKIICPVRNSFHYRQLKITPDNFFNYVYVLEDKENISKKKKEYGDYDMLKEILKESKNLYDEETRNRLDGIEKKETKIVYDDLGNKLIISTTSEKPKAIVETEKLNEYEEFTDKNNKILKIKNIDDIISYVTYERKIVNNTYIGTLYVSPLLLNEASFYISCDNSLTLNESVRGKTAIVKITISPNYLKMHGCDFVGLYSSHFYFSNKWENLPNNYVCEMKVEDDAILALACPSHTKMHPSDCFESVIKDNEIYKKDVLIESKHSFILKKVGHPHLSFIQIKKINYDHIICKCYETVNGQYKEVTMKVLYEPYIMGAPKANLSKPDIKYVDIDFNIFAK